MKKNNTLNNITETACSSKTTKNPLTIKQQKMKNKITKPLLTNQAQILQAQLANILSKPKIDTAINKLKTQKPNIQQTSSQMITSDVSNEE